MIQPTEGTPGEFGHPMWKRNAFLGLALCVVGIVMIVSVVAAMYGIIVLAIGGAWAVGACLVGAAQEHRDAVHHDTMHHA